MVGVGNGCVALVGFCVAIRSRHEAPAKDEIRERSEFRWGTASIYVAIGLSGLTALGAEVIWTRQLSLLLGATVYSFSTILAVFLTGLGIGSSVGAFVSRSASNPRFALGTCQLMLVATIAWTAFMVNRSLPYWPIDPGLSTSPWLTFQLDLDGPFDGPFAVTGAVQNPNAQGPP